MNLRLFVFLALGALSSIASANWFDDYQVKALSEASKSKAVEVEVIHSSYPSMHSFMLGTTLPRGVLAPSFDVVAREMVQIKEQQVLQEYALITYLQKSRVISVE